MPAVVKHEGFIMILQAAELEQDVLVHRITQETVVLPGPRFFHYIAFENGNGTVVDGNGVKVALKQLLKYGLFKTDGGRMYMHSKEFNANIWIDKAIMVCETVSTPAPKLTFYRYSKAPEGHKLSVHLRSMQDFVESTAEAAKETEHIMDCILADADLQPYLRPKPADGKKKKRKFGLDGRHLPQFTALEQIADWLPQKSGCHFLHDKSVQRARVFYKTSQKVRASFSVGLIDNTLQYVMKKLLIWVWT